jgi:hypothetical protein
MRPYSNFNEEVSGMSESETQKACLGLKQPNTLLISISKTAWRCCRFAERQSVEFSYNPEAPHFAPKTETCSQRSSQISPFAKSIFETPLDCVDWPNTLA